MGHSHSANIFHLVFSTKNREPVIAQPEALWAYASGIVRNLRGDACAISGTSNHVHLLLDLPTHISVAEATQKIKANSSRWLRQRGRWNGWQEGWALFRPAG